MKVSHFMGRALFVDAVNRPLRADSRYRSVQRVASTARRPHPQHPMIALKSAHRPGKCGLRDRQSLRKVGGRGGAQGQPLSNGMDNRLGRHE